MKSPAMAFLYSFFVPGLGQLYLGEKAKGWTLLCMDAGIAISLWMNHSWLSWLLLGTVYLAVMFPAAMDAYQCASGKPRVFNGDSVPYVIIMLLVVGPFAIPLLWQSLKFSKGAKIGWTVAVILIALLVIATMGWVASFLDQFMKQNSGIIM